MRRNKIGFGIFLVTVGIFFLLASIGIVDWTIIYSIFKLWPLLLVVIGINIVFNRNVIVRAITWLTLLAVLITYSYVFHGSNFGKPIESRNVTISKLAETKSGSFATGLGFIDLNIDSTNDDLIDGTIAARGLQEDINYSESKDNVDINYTQDEHTFDFLNSAGKQNAKLNINKDISWDKIKVDTGFVNGDLDLSELMVSNIDINSGFSKFKLKLSDKSIETNIKINTGFSEFAISVPQNAGLRIKIDGALNSKSFNNVGVTKDGDYYVSQNYDTAASKIDINCSMGFSKITIDRY